ncbi:MAG: tyrosine-type recombinase/integrase [Caldilinea sp.]|nr:tyrosine-type recombinase/integrase [Caldilineaceae bacterium]MCB9115827.1 tyrosine-type recombinase/integrase [Caldilineaceae bacterium]MCB9119894.1 tyrosine-type recombinase/integrase [Caldilineaceae bacterium]MCO5209113.1 tyrosine-type recombinase/integrase [Caldilinea sp.]
MALLLDHGLRVGELTGLQVTDFDLKAGSVTFYRPKVDKTQTHKLSPDAARALTAWFATDAPALGSLLRGSRKGGALTDAGMAERSVSERVRILVKLPASTAYHPMIAGTSGPPTGQNASNGYPRGYSRSKRPVAGHPWSCRGVTSKLPRLRMRGWRNQRWCSRLRRLAY